MMIIKDIIQNICLSSSTYPIILDRTCEINTCVNPYSYHIVRKNLELYSQFNNIFVDGMTMCWWISLLWGHRIRRLSFDMSGIAVDLFSRLNNKECKESIYFIGSTQENIDKTVNQFCSGYPNMKIAGFRNGYFRNHIDRHQSIEEIISLNPTFVAVGMGSPLQEQYVLDLKRAGYKGVAFTCGGFLHQSTDRLNYYPNWINKYNLRVVYRLFHEKGLWGRLYNVLIEFPILFTWDTITTKLYIKRKR